MTDKITEQAVQMMVYRLVERLDPDQVILFGSQARKASNYDGVCFHGSSAPKSISRRC